RQFRHELGHAPTATVTVDRRDLLLHERDLVLEGPRVVGADLDVEAILQRRDDAPAARVVLGVGAGHDDDIERQVDAVALDLDVALLHQVEETDLDLLREVRQLVDGEDAAMAARDETVVDGLLVGQIAALGHLHGIDLADEVGHGDVRRGELLAVALRRSDPGDGDRVALGGHAAPARRAQRRERVVVDLAPRDRRHQRVEEVSQGTDDAALSLAAFAEEDHVMPGEQRVLDLGNDGVVVADEPGQQPLTTGQTRERVATHLLAYGTHLITGCLHLAECARPDGLTHDSRLRWVGGADHTQVPANETTKRPGARRLSSPATRTPDGAAPRSRPDALASRARHRARA